MLLWQKYLSNLREGGCFGFLVFRRFSLYTGAEVWKRKLFTSWHRKKKKNEKKRRGKKKEEEEKEKEADKEEEETDEEEDEEEEGGQNQIEIDRDRGRETVPREIIIPKH